MLILGWSLGEHQEWSKFSNFEVATRVPLIISMPENRKEFKFTNIIDDKVFSSNKKRWLKKYKKNKRHSYSELKRSHKIYNHPVELIDLFPTIVDLSGLPFINQCPNNSSSIQLCTEGFSLSQIILNNKNKQTEMKNDIFNIHKSKENSNSNITNISQIPKQIAFSQYPRPCVTPSISPDSDQPKLIDTKIMGYSMRTNRFRYTVWLSFNHTNFYSDWDNIIAHELYDHKIDPDENHNVVEKSFYQRYINKLRIKLRSNLS